MRGRSGSDRASSAVLTVPNALSLLRILMIPVFVVLIVRPSTTTAGLILFSIVAATDWVDGWVARRTGSVTELGKVLDPLADRLAMAAGLIAFVIRGAFPLWAALLILVRDAAVLVVGAVVLAGRRVRIDVRFIGKIATLTLMFAVPFVSWGALGLPLAAAALAAGWVGFAVGIIESYLAAGAYVGDVRRATSATS